MTNSVTLKDSRTSKATLIHYSGLLVQHSLQAIAGKSECSQSCSPNIGAIVWATGAGYSECSGADYRGTCQLEACHFTLPTEPMSLMQLPQTLLFLFS